MSIMEVDLALEDFRSDLKRVKKLLKKEKNPSMISSYMKLSYLLEITIDEFEAYE